jgi:hypothetical protein
MSSKEGVESRKLKQKVMAKETSKLRAAISVGLTGTNTRIIQILD